MDTELRNFYDRTCSTYYYSFDSQCGDQGNGINAQTGNFDILIQPFPFPKHNSSQRAVFTLHSFYVSNQDGTERASGDADKDISAFYVEVNGLGFSKNQYVSNKTCGKHKGLGFFILNDDAGADNSNSNIYQVNSGSTFKGPPILCSNPSGTTINVKVFDATTGEIITNNENLSSFIEFSIQIIPDEITSGN